MPMDSELQLQVLAHTPLTAVVRRALDDPGAEVEAWDATRIHGGMGAAGGGCTGSSAQHAQREPLSPPAGCHGRSC
jgi:hypothetical protein